jgi:hypothetical protein
MSEKRIDRKFTLSTGAVNEYGFVLPTEGCDLSVFLANPIGYYMHDREDGVLVRWEDVAIEGDSITGYPVINLAHPKGERAVEEIEGGFMNGASVGSLKFLAEPVIMGDAVVVPRWAFKECSIVDNPGNREAMGEEELELADGTGITLADFTNINIQRMKTVTLPINAPLLELLSLTDIEVTPDAIIAGIKNLKTEAEQANAAKATLVQELADLKAADCARQVADVLEKALEEGRVTKATAERLGKQFASMPTELADLVNTMPVYSPIVSKLKPNGDDLPKELADKSWDELDRAGLLKRLRDEHPEAYARKFDEKFAKK